MPRVSAIVPVFNAERTIGEAIDSILAQSFQDFEIVAVDDGSGDASLRSLEPWRDRIKLLRQPNRGPSAARNHGVRESSGELLAFLDADDRWRPAMLEKMVAALDAHPAAALAYCDVAVIDSEGRALMTALAGEQGAPTVADMLEKLWPIMPSAVVMRRAALEAAGGWPEALTSFEDVYLWLLMREHGEFVHVNETLSEWRFAHFPMPLKAPGGQEHAGRIFVEMVRERWSCSGEILVQARERAPRSILGYIGLLALEGGDRVTARNAFARAIRLDPWRVKNHLRYVRTFLPAVAARMLGGNSRVTKG
jgi:glycosyltransferase involved in cell wall biosynthesis